jgi:hypothetical protein
LDTVAGEDPVAVLEPDVIEPEPVEVAVEFEVVVLLDGSIVALYDAQVALGERGQVLSMQMLWS